VAGLRVREVGVGFLHALEGFVDGGIFSRRSARACALGLDPVAQALARRLCKAIGQHARRRAEPLDRHELADILGVGPCISERNVAPEGVGHDRDGGEALLVDELGEVVEVRERAVVAVGGPLAVAVAAQVRGDHVPLGSQGLGGPVPAA